MIRILTNFIAVAVLALSTAVQAESTMIEKFGNQAYDTLDSFVAKLTTPLFSKQDTECLARNIYYESKNEPEEGMVAVGVVTINRSESPKYPKTICGVVNQKTTIGQAIVCQFSWTCTMAKNRKPREDDPMWKESQRIANELATGGYSEWREKYGESFHFHAVHVNPGWKLKRVAKTGRHIFYH